MATSGVETAPPERKRPPEPEDVFISEARLGIIGQQVEGLRQAANEVYGVCDLVRRDAAEQRLTEVALEMEQLAAALSLFDENALWVYLEPHRMAGSEESSRMPAKYRVNVGFSDAVVTNLQMLTSCFFPQKRQGMREIPDPERDAFLGKLMDGKQLRVRVRKG